MIRYAGLVGHSGHGEAFGGWKGKRCSRVAFEKVFVVDSIRSSVHGLDIFKHWLSSTLLLPHHVRLGLAIFQRLNLH